jgi:hypothetical protein
LNLLLIQCTRRYLEAFYQPDRVAPCGLYPCKPLQGAG